MFDSTIKMEFAINRFIETNEHHIKRMIAEAITKAVKMAVMEDYVKLAKVVDEVILSPETRTMIESIIREKILEEIDHHIKDMFGDGKN